MSQPSPLHPDGSLVLDQPVQLPDVLDMVIVGGGPAGTAAAFRAKELGLSALVIDHDDLMKRIRDYAKDKPILPTFGGGDAMRFPQGGPLVSQLRFAPIDKDEMCRQYKGLYLRHSVPAQIGIELTGLEWDDKGLWNVLAWNHNTGAAQNYVAKHVLLAIGRGVPRRFDIPGNVQGIAFRLSDPRNLLGQASCVIGGGTSAAEAVIAISNVKTREADATPVYWSYRGEKMPTVSKALAEQFFDAFMRNGNVRYLPNSEPASVFTSDDQRDHLCIRTARKEMPGLPTETLHLEFLKPFCIACIGEDLPLGFLGGLGIHQVSGGPRNRKRFFVSPLHETLRSNLYLIGDLLSPAYLQTADFEADPSTFEEIKRRGNIKSALRDGVLAAEVVAQKLQGATHIIVRLEYHDEEDADAAGAEKRAAAAAPEAARLIRILQGDTQADEYPLRMGGETSLGNRGADICFPEDRSLSDRHAVISHGPDGCMLKPEDPQDTVFLQPAAGASVEIPDEVVVRAGNQWLVFGGPPDITSVVHYNAHGQEVQRIRLSAGTVVMGRQAAVLLDSSDGSLSRRHLAVSLQSGRRFIRDLESVNGTHIRVDRPIRLNQGDRIWLGQQVLQFHSSEAPSQIEEVSFDTSVVSAPKPSPAERAVQEARHEAPAAASDSGECVVTFQNLGKSFPIRKGQTICELAEEQGLKIKAQCHRGICGSDPIRIVSGHDNLNPRSEGEEETLEDMCSMEGAGHRLACLARPTGPVVVEILKSPGS